MVTYDKNFPKTFNKQYINVSERSRDYLKVTSPKKCQILDPPPPLYVTVSNFFRYTPSPPCH